MPSRRDLLRVGATLGIASTAGCLDVSNSYWDGFVQLKAVHGRRPEDSAVELVRVTIDRDDAVDVRTNQEYAEFFDDPATPVVDEDTHDALDWRFPGGLEYVLGICEREPTDAERFTCRNTWTTRRSFNRVQVYDRVKAVLVDDTFHVLDVDAPDEPGVPE